MSVRKRKWTTAKGEAKTAWIVDYADQSGVRRQKTFERKKEADAWADSTGVAVREGTHVADSASVAVKEAGALWIKTAEEGDDEREALERTTVDQYKQHLRLHIEPFLARTKLSQISAPMVRKFASDLRASGRSPTMVKYVIRSLGALLAEAQESGMVARNAVHELRRRRRRRAKQDRNGGVKEGVDYPRPDEIRLIVAGLEGSRWRPLILTAIFTGLRASELRGLRWEDVDLKNAELHVRQRADRYTTIGKLKTDASERTVPLPPELVRTLREWKLKCPVTKLDLVFPTGKRERRDGTIVGGTIEHHTNIVQRGFMPAQIKAGVTVPLLDKEGKPVLDKDGKPMVAAKYTGLHALRHFYASWCINRAEDGGLGLPPKVVQHRLGHSSITVTMDTYGHLFPRGDDGTELAAAEKVLLG